MGTTAIPEEPQLVHLIADNLQFGMQVSFEATVKRSGKMTLPKDILGQMIKRFRRGKLTIKCLIEKPLDFGQKRSLFAGATREQCPQLIESRKAIRTERMEVLTST